MAPPSKNLEKVLLEHLWASEHNLEWAHRCRKRGQSLVDSLIDLGAVRSECLARALAQLYSLPFHSDVDERVIDKNLLAKIPVKYSQRNRILALGTDRTSLIVAIADPSNYHALDDLGVLFGLHVHPVVVPFDVLDHLIASAYDGALVNLIAQGPIIVLEELRLETVADEFFQQPFDVVVEGDPRLVRLINAIIWRAISEHASEIHVEPCEQNLLVRFRAEAAPYNVVSAPKCLGTALISSIKAMAGLDVAEGQTLAGDIRLLVAGQVICVLVSIYPGACGERVTARLNGCPKQQLLGVIDDFAAAACAVTSNGNEVTKSPFCPKCGASIVVAAAVFCKDCGARLRHTPGSAKTELSLLTTS